MSPEIRVMRDVFIEEVCARMLQNPGIFFLTADFGSPKLDKIKEKFKDRFINVGIAEQNMVNISTGLALEGFTVYAYAIAPFLTMRAYEQIRVNLSLHSQLKEININLIGVGAGLSYDVSGPTHHCLEDLAIIRTLPNLVVFSPSDWVLARKFVDYSLAVKKPKYIRFDGKPLPQIYSKEKIINFSNGFHEIKKGKKLCIISTGYMTQKAIKIAEILAARDINIGIIDVFLLAPINEKLLFSALKKYKCILTLEEGFIGKGGLDSLVSGLLHKKDSHLALRSMGFGDAYVFDVGQREYLHKINGLGPENIIRNIKNILRNF